MAGSAPRTSVAAERAALAALWWARQPRRSDAAIRAVTAGLTEGERAELRAVLAEPGVDAITDSDLAARLLVLAGEA
jgi:hypothetical protein